MLLDVLGVSVTRGPPLRTTLSRTRQITPLSFHLKTLSGNSTVNKKVPDTFFSHLAVVMQPPLDEPLPGVGLCLFEGRLAQFPRGVGLQSEQLE